MEYEDDLWLALLSGDGAKIRRAWGELSDDQARSILAALRNMAADREQAAERRQAAAVAIAAIRDAF